MKAFVAVLGIVVGLLFLVPVLMVLFLKWAFFLERIINP